MYGSAWPSVMTVTCVCTYVCVCMCVCVCVCVHSNVYLCSALPYQATLVHWTKKVIVEEGHSINQLVHIL